MFSLNRKLFLFHSRNHAKTSVWSHLIDIFKMIQSFCLGTNSHVIFSSSRTFSALPSFDVFLKYINIPLFHSLHVRLYSRNLCIFCFLCSIIILTKIQLFYKKSPKKIHQKTTLQRSRMQNFSNCLQTILIDRLHTYNEFGGLLQIIYKLMGIRLNR